MKNLFNLIQKKESMKKVTFDFRRKTIFTTLQELFYNCRLFFNIKNISFAILMLFVFEAKAQINTANPALYYNYVRSNPALPNIHYTSSNQICNLTLPQQSATIISPFNIVYPSIITKKSNNQFNYQLFYTDEFVDPSYCRTSTIGQQIENTNSQYATSSNLIFVSNPNILKKPINGNLLTTGNVYWNTIPSSDKNIIDIAKQNYDSNKLIVNAVHKYYNKFNHSNNLNCNNAPKVPNNKHITLKRNIEIQSNINIYDETPLDWWGITCQSNGFTTANWDLSETKIRYGYKYISTVSYRVTDPNNWTTYQSNDYDFVNSTPINPVYKTTRFAEILGGNTFGGTFMPSFFINSAPDTNIWNSRIGPVELYHRVYGSSGTFQFNNIGKGGIAWSSMVASTVNGLVRYWYTLDDDPATTSGYKSGFVDIMFNAGKCVPNTLGTVSNPKTLCIGESWDLQAAIINNNGGTFINLPFPELSDNISITGTGVTGTTFTSSTAGTYSLNVKITYDNGEENFPITIKVLANPLVQNSTNFKYGDGIIGGSTATQLEICQGDKSLNTTTIANTFFNNTSNTFYGVTAPTDFSWGLKQGSTIGAYVASGTGTSKNNTFNYSTLAPGDYFMEMYHGFSSTSTICTSKQYYFKVVVKPLPANIVVTKDTFSICNNKESVNLTANTVSPTGVVWSGSGVSNNVFSGSSVSPNTYLITGTLTGTNSCSRLDTVIIINKAGVSLSQVSNTNDLCLNTNAINLNDYIIVADKGGKHTNPLYSNTISNDSIFNPTIVASHNIRYIKTVANGCSDTISYAIKVNPLPTAPSYQKNYDSVCIVTGGATSNITLTNFYNIASASGTTGSWSGSNQSSGVVDINSLAVGTYNYLYIQKTANLCLDTTVFTLKANNGSSSLIQFTKNFDTVCHSSGNINLNNYNQIVKGGTWTYTPNSIQNNVLLSSFMPINSIENITYTADTLGCSMQKTLSLFRFQPSASAGVDKNICSNGSAVLLQGTPIGGAWKLDSIGTPVSVFDPKTFSVTQSNEARAYNLYYTITSNGCSNTDTAIYTIILKPKIQYVKRDDSICSSVSTLNLTTNYGVNPNNGIWEGSNLNNADFSIASSGPGLKNFKYIFQSQYGCYDTTYYTLRVDAKDSTGLFEPSDYKVCEASAPINLNSFKLLPSTGLYSSIGGNNNIIDSLFYPTTSGVGTFTINYATSNKSCQYNLSKKIFVVAKPAMPEYNGKIKGCTNENILFSVKNADATYSYYWDNNATASNTFSTIAGNKTVKLFSKNYLGCKSIDNNIQVTLDDPSGSLTIDKSEISDNEDVNFSINSLNNVTSINWNFNDGSDVMTGNNSSIVHRFYNPSSTIDIEYSPSVELISSSNCKLVINNSKIKVLKRKTNSIINNDSKLNISIYPNPFMEDININNESNKKIEFEISDVTGKIVKMGQITPGTSTHNLSNLSNGLYFIKIEKDVYKIIKNN